MGHPLSFWVIYFFLYFLVFFCGAICVQALLSATKTWLMGFVLVSGENVLTEGAGFHFLLTKL
jgi:hypothetical protein